MSQERTNADEVMSLVCLLQSVIHKIDDLDYKTAFKHEMKQRTNAYLKHIEKFVDNVVDVMNTDEADQYVQIVKHIDEIANKITIK